MRIVAGKFRGARIEAPKGLATRPTSDRVRQALFNLLTHGAPLLDLEALRVLDLFAGSGALGLEALSRGASFVLFVDEGVEARALLRGNVEALGAGGTTRVFRRDATKLGPAHPIPPFSLVFADPPYGKGLADAALVSALAGGWLSPHALIVVEESKAAGFAASAAFSELERRAYDDTEFVFLRLAAASASGNADHAR
jgi:16S rRNA (guanine966-N2)-methyltransferase